MTVHVFIGLGSNMNDPLMQLTKAVRAMDAIESTRVVQVSAVYQTEPMGPANQSDYLNAVAEIETALEPLDLLDQLQAIELQQGRQRHGERWHQRPLDLDILLYDARRIDSARLQVPHPGMHTRAFVLVPLQELAADITIPGRGPVAALVNNTLVGGIIRRREETLWP